MLSSCFFYSCKTQMPKEPIQEKISHYIGEKCIRREDCRIQIKDTMDFSYDKLYVFEMAVENDVIIRVLGSKFYSSSPYYSRKWFFLKDNQVVQSEQHLIPEIDNPIDDGDVDFEIKNVQEKYDVFGEDAVFEVERIKTDTGEFYRLHCVSCK